MTGRRSETFGSFLSIGALAISAWAGGCASAQKAGTTAPTPYTAAQIRDGNPPGTEMVFLIEQAGTPPARRTVRFLEGDGEHAVTESSMATAAGDPVGEAERGEASWTELRDHAAFPTDATKRMRTTCTVPVGRFDCWLYEVSGEEEGTSTVTRFYFADDRPGPPVLMEIETDGERTYRMTLLEDTRERREP
jgi:hypothetical protein